jgi:hypothetical protein
MNYDDVDAPKGEKVVLEYADEASLGAPPPKKKRKKGGTPKKKDKTPTAAAADQALPDTGEEGAVEEA